MPHKVDHHAILDRIAAERGGQRNVLRELDPRRTAQLVIDMQNGFMEPGAPVEVPMARDVFVGYTTPAEGDPPWSSFAERLGPAADGHKAAFLRGAHHWQLWPGLEVTDADSLIEKKRFSAFVPGSSDLHEVLQQRGIDTVIVTGTMTNCCCESTARDAMQMNYRTIFVPDATAATTEHEHAATLHTMGRIFADLLSSDELIGMLERARAPA
jgi:ureidoacrylate peracid hydrolase